MILWQWSVSQDDWDYVTEANTEQQKKIVARAHRRRNPKGTRFKWTEGYKPKRFRPRKKAE